MTQPPADWYPDPNVPGQVRYYDGHKWTEHTAPMYGEQKPEQKPEQKTTKVPLFGARAAAKELAQENEWLRQELDRIGGLEVFDAKTELGAVRTEINASRSQVAAAQIELAKLQREHLDVRDAIDLQEFGLYDYEHPGEDSISLGHRLEEVRAKIKEMVRLKKATQATGNFVFDNSKAKGDKFIRELSKMALAAYNAEAEAAIKAARAGGYATGKARMDRMAKTIETAGALINLRISGDYRTLRARELKLAVQHADTLKAEKEAERERRAELREQRKAEEELAAQKAKLQKEREHYINALQAVRARGDEAAIEELEAKLADVEKAVADVDYRAANIKAGYVYVISNIGAFGENMVKIGMTRRLEPMDRVNELGDASVPFRFDVHALFFSEDAVAVESMLHRHFASRKVNRINSRREFFYCTPQEVLETLEKAKVSVVEYKTTAQALEYRESLALAEMEQHQATHGANSPQDNNTSGRHRA